MSRSIWWALQTKNGEMLVDEDVGLGAFLFKTKRMAKEEISMLSEHGDLKPVRVRVEVVR